MNENYQQPAFPTYSQNKFNTLELSSEGVTSLDYFAAKHIPHDIQKPRNFKHWLRWFFGYSYKSSTAEYSDIARSAYAQAAAMLEERKKYIK